MGDPSILYCFGGALLVSCVAAGAVLRSRASLGVKVLALVPELVALAFVAAVAQIPGLGHRPWVGGVVLAMSIAAACTSYMVLKNALARSVRTSP